MALQYRQNNFEEMHTESLNAQHLNVAYTWNNSNDKRSCLQKKSLRANIAIFVPGEKKSIKASLWAQDMPYNFRKLTLAFCLLDWTKQTTFKCRDCQQSYSGVNAFPVLKRSLITQRQATCRSETISTCFTNWVQKCYSKCGATMPLFFFTTKQATKRCRITEGWGIEEDISSGLALRPCLSE